MRKNPLRTFMVALIYLGSSCRQDPFTAKLGLNWRGQVYEPDPLPPPPAFALDSIDRYQSCDELRDDLRARLLTQMQNTWSEAQFYRSQNTIYQDDRVLIERSIMPSASAASTPSPTSTDSDKSATASSVGTNIQVLGVDESDEIKMNDRSIFIADNQQNSANLTISIVTKQPLASAGKITIASLSSPQLYTVGDRLVVTGMIPPSFSPNGIYTASQFAIKIYDVKGEPVLQKDTSLSSQPVASRMIGSKLFVVLRESLKQKSSIPYPTPADLSDSFEHYAAKLNINDIFDFSDDSVAGIRCKAMVKLASLSDQLRFQRVIAFDVIKGEIVDEVAIPGNDSGIFMSNQAIYSYGQASYTRNWIDPSNSAAVLAQDAARRRAYETLVIKKVSLDPETGALTPAAIGNVAGHLKSFDSQWAFNEIIHDGESLLSVVTTTGDVRDQSGTNPAANHLVVLRQKAQDLVEAGSVKDFGANEDVRAVRYAGIYAYVVTFKRTDPLFTIDLADPFNPKIVGELKIPGFSMYLQPHSDAQLLGIGYQTEESGETDINRAFYQGVLVQLFDIKDPAASTRMDYVTLGKRGSYSEANQDHHAFYYDPELSLVGMPVVLFDDGSDNAGLNGQNTHAKRSFSGAVLFRIENNKLEEVKRLSHFDYLSPICQSNLLPLSWTTSIVANPEVRRLFRDGNTIYAVSNFAVQAVDATTFAELTSLRLDVPDCRPQFGGGGYE